MKLLAFDTSTEVMSIAVCRSDGAQVRQWLHTGAGGAQASGGLIAGVMDLLAQAGLELGQLDAICFGAGPGSFTGLRTACSVAQGFAFGAGVPVLPVDTLLAVAEEARGARRSDVANIANVANVVALRITALLDARMDEMYVASYDYLDGQWSIVAPSHLVRPEAFQAPGAGAGAQLLAGNVWAAYGERLLPGIPAGLQHLSALPTAAAMLRLAPALLAAGKAVRAEHALPAYIRDKVAKTTAERMAEKAALAAAVPRVTAQ